MDNSSSNGELLSVNQLCERYEASPLIVARYVGVGELPVATETTNVDGKLFRRFRPEDIEKVFKKRTHPVEPMVRNRDNYYRRSRRLPYSEAIQAAKQAIGLIGGVDRLKVVNDVQAIADSLGGMEELIALAEALQ